MIVGEQGTQTTDTRPTDRVRIKEPLWVPRVRSKCRGCHDDFYNYGVNSNGKTWCWLMRANFARLKGKPSCYH